MNLKQEDVDEILMWYCAFAYYLSMSGLRGDAVEKRINRARETIDRLLGREDGGTVADEN